MLVRLARVLALALGDEVHLPPPRRQSAGIFAPSAEQNDLGNVAEIEPHAPAIGAAILSGFVPDDVGFVIETPSLHHFQTVGKQRVGNPEIEVSGRRGDIGDRQGADVGQFHRAISVQTAMLGRHLASAIHELPRRIGEDCAICAKYKLRRSQI